jgi:carbon storage regulator
VVAIFAVSAGFSTTATAFAGHWHIEFTSLFSCFPFSESRPMLVLSRKRDQQIIIGDGIVITVVEIRGDKVRLGIEAPTDVPVHRKEVYEAIKAHNSQATSIKD